MAQKLIQTQQMSQTQILAPQQLMLVKLLELPVSELEARINNELVENAALEEGKTDENEPEQEEGDFDNRGEEFENKSTESDDSLADYFSSDDVPDYLLNKKNNERERLEIPLGDTTSFYEELSQQVGERDLTEHQATLMEYLIGSLDNDGLLRKPLYSIVDEMEIYHNISTNEKELEEVLTILQEFEPRGIGARSLKECLRLQVDIPDNHSKWKKAQLQIIDNCFDDYTHKRWDKICKRLNISQEDLEEINAEMRHLNPRPGSALDEATGRSSQQIIPDFIIETDEEGEVTVRLNRGEVPELKISRSFRETFEEYNKNKNNMSRQQKEAYVYTKQKVEAAQTFIEALRQRQNTLLSTMQTIVKLQHDFFVEGDETLLKPMILKDVAERTGLDISTISRVSNSKYAETEFGVFPLKYFFNDKFITEDGEEHSTLKIKSILRDLINNEDKQKPLTDESLAESLKKAGFPVARRTVAKYREQMGLPVARMRR